MVLGILVLVSMSGCAAGEWKTIPIFSGAVRSVSRFRWIRSCGSPSRCGAALVLYMGSLRRPMAGAAGRWFLCRLGASGRSAWSGRIRCPDAEYGWAFLRFLRGARADTTLDALSSGWARLGPSLRSGTPHVFPVLGGWIFCSWSATPPI